MDLRVSQNTSHETKLPRGRRKGSEVQQAQQSFVLYPRLIHANRGHHPCREPSRGKCCTLEGLPFSTQRVDRDTGTGIGKLDGSRGTLTKKNVVALLV